jgi:hypothetical protein
MSDAEQRFMAFEGLLQWTAAAIEQGNRIAALSAAAWARQKERRLLFAQMRTEHHFFAIAAHKVLEHRGWAQSLGLCAAVDFSMLDEFDATLVSDLRNMREHVVEYFKGNGWEKERWRVETPEFSADASSCVGTLIGGRLDWKRFAQACEHLLPTLLAEPTPYPPQHSAPFNEKGTPSERR